MGFSRPTLQQLIDRIASDFVAKITGATTLALRSTLLIMARAFAGATHLLYGYLDNMSKELFAKTATADVNGGKLDTIGSELGVLRKAASAASGNIVITGTATTVIPVSSAFVSEIGNRYLTDEETTIDAGGSVTVAVTCDTAGSAGNESAGAILTLESPIVGANSDATIDADGITGGTDEETDAAYRKRILARKQFAPHGGAALDVSNWCLEVPYVTRAWIYPLYQGPGTFSVYFVCDGQSPISPTGAQVTEVTDYLIGHTDILGNLVGIPVTAEPGMLVAAPTLRTMTYTIKLYPNTLAVQAQVLLQLEDFLLSDGFPGNTLYMSRMSERIGAAIGEERSQVTHINSSLAGDVVLAYDEVAILNTVVFVDYP